MLDRQSLENMAANSLSDISGLIKRGDVSPVFIVTQCLEQIERLQPTLNAFITVSYDTALRQAKAAEAELRDGQWKGPLHGIPIGIKDFYDTAGIRTTAAFDGFIDRVPSHDAAAVTRLQRAGAVVIGKTNMHTLGMGTSGLVSCFGPPKNPWNADYIPGGSSSGSAVAVASGMCYATLDTDAIGSCRLPASCCGVVGFKGTYGLIDMTGILAGEKPPDQTVLRMSHTGITARTVEDIALVLDVLAERTGASTFSTSLAHQRPLRVGAAKNCLSDPEITKAFERAVGIVRSLGYPTRAADAPFVDFSQGISNIEQDRQTITARAFEEIDVIILPTVPATVPSVAESLTNPQILSPRNTLFANYYGLPAISIPCGFDSHGVPAGLQCVSRPGDEPAVLQMARRYLQKAASGEAA